MPVFGAINLPPEAANYVIAAVLILLRLSMMVFLLPAISDTVVPVRIRMALVLALSLALLPVLLPSQLAAVEANDMVVLALYESAIGAALGFSFRVLIFALMIAGTTIAQAISLSQLFGAGAASEPNPAVALLLISAGAALFVTLDMHTQTIGLLYESYRLFPLGEMPSTERLAEWATERSVDAFKLGISLSLPFVLINFVYNAVLGMINQAMPQVMVTFIGVPANVMAGFVILVLAVSAILVAWLREMGPAFQGFW